MPKFETVEEIQEWFTRQGRDAAMCLTARNALRMVPELLLHDRESIEKERLLSLSLGAFRAVTTLAAASLAKQSKLDTINQSGLCFRAYKSLIECRTGEVIFGNKANIDDELDEEDIEEDNIDLALKVIEVGTTSGIIITDEPDFFLQGALQASVNSINGRITSADEHAAKNAVIATVAARVAMESDAALISDGVDPHEILLRPLWEERWKSPRVVEGWVDLRKRLIDQDSNWVFWIDIYERLLVGDPVDWLGVVSALSLSDEFWANDPVEVNKNLVSIQRRSSSDSKERKSSIAEEIEEALREPALLGASTDFSYDSVEELIRLAPFHEDEAVLQRLAESPEFTAYVSELKDMADDFLLDLASGAPNVPQGLVVRMASYSRELDSPLDQLRPRRLWDLSSYIQAHLEDDDTRHALGNILAGELGRIVKKQSDLIYRFLRSTLDSLKVVDEINVSATVSASEFLGKASETLSQLRKLHSDRLPELDYEVLEKLSDDLDFLYEAARKSEVELSSDIERSGSSEIFWRRAKVFILTVKRLTLRTLQAIHKAFEVTAPYVSLIGVAATVFPKPFFAALAALFALLGMSLL